MKCTLFIKWIFPPWCNASSELFLAAKIQTVHSWKKKIKWNTRYAHQAKGRTWGKYPVNSTRSSVDIFRSSLFLCRTACCAAALAGRAVGWWAPSALTSCKGVSRRSDQMTGHAQACFFFVFCFSSSGLCPNNNPCVTYPHQPLELGMVSVPIQFIRVFQPWQHSFPQEAELH